MNYIESLLSIHKCKCGRPQCKYFAPEYGENGASFSQRGVEKILEDAKKLVEHLEALLSEK